MDEEGSIRSLWVELGRIRKQQGITYGQLHTRIGGNAKMSKKTLQDRLSTGRKTCWEDLRVVAVVGLGQDEREWKDRYDRGQGQVGVGAGRRAGASFPESDMSANRSTGRWPRTAVLLAVEIVAGLVAVALWTASSFPIAAVQNPECVRVSSGEIRVYDVPGDEKRSFLKFKDERIRFAIPYEEAVDSEGHTYRRVLTPSRNDGYGWIRDNAANVTQSC